VEDFKNKFILHMDVELKDRHVPSQVYQLSLDQELA